MPDRYRYAPVPDHPIYCTCARCTDPEGKVVEAIDAAQARERTLQLRRKDEWVQARYQRIVGLQRQAEALAEQYRRPPALRNVPEQEPQLAGVSVKPNTALGYRISADPPYPTYTPPAFRKPPDPTVITSKDTVLGGIITLIAVPAFIVLAIGMVVVAGGNTPPPPVPTVAPFEPVQAKWNVVVGCTGSMEPALECKQRVIVQEPTDEALEVGDIIGFPARACPAFPEAGRGVIHRIVQVKEINGEVAYLPKGDANPGPDPCWVRHSEVKYVVFYITDTYGVITRYGG